MPTSRVFVVLVSCFIVIRAHAQQAMAPGYDAAPTLPASAAAAAAVLAPLLTFIPEGVTLNARTVQSPALSPAATAPQASPGLPCPGSELVLLDYGRYIQSQNGSLELVAYTNAPAGIGFYTCPGNFSGVYCSGKAWLTSAGTDLACIVSDLITPDALDSPYQPTPVLGTGIVCEYTPQGIIAFADALPDSSVTYMSSRGGRETVPLPYHDACNTDADCPGVLANYLCNAGQCQLPLPSSCFAVK